MYDWRRMNSDQRKEVQLIRRIRNYPKHSPPHFSRSERLCYHICGANYEHKPIIGMSPVRLARFSESLCFICNSSENVLYAWCVLPNHWHVLVETLDVIALLHKIGWLHGRCSFEWNKEDNEPGRKCWHCCTDRRIRSEAHFCVTRNYILYNPVKHGYVHNWEDWPFSNISEYLEAVSRENALHSLNTFPFLTMGQGWDEDKNGNGREDGGEKGGRGDST